MVYQLEKSRPAAMTITRVLRILIDSCRFYIIVTNCLQFLKPILKGSEIAFVVYG